MPRILIQPYCPASRSNKSLRIASDCVKRSERELLERSTKVLFIQFSMLLAFNQWPTVRFWTMMVGLFNLWSNEDVPILELWWERPRQFLLNYYTINIHPYKHWLINHGYGPHSFLVKESLFIFLNVFHLMYHSPCRNHAKLIALASKEPQLIIRNEKKKKAMTQLFVCKTPPLNTLISLILL